MRFFSIELRSFGFEIDTNVYKLPIAQDPLDFIFIDSSFYNLICSYSSVRIEKLYDDLRRTTRHKLLVGVEGKDWFHLAQHPNAYRQFDIILKNGGIFKDLDMYNYENGACSENRNWLDTSTRRKETFDVETLARLRLSYSCMIAIDRRVRRAARKILPHVSRTRAIFGYLLDLFSDVEDYFYLKVLDKQPRYFLFCYCGLTHAQRIELLELLKELKYDGFQKILPLNEECLWGTAHGRNPLTEGEINKINERCARLGIMGKKLHRLRYKRMLRDHRVALAPVGYGEITFRHAEALSARRVLVCQDLSHVHMMFPFKDLSNVVYCKSDFSDLGTKLEWVRNHPRESDEIAEQGYRDWVSWSSSIESVLEKGVVEHIERATCSQKS
jgi:hypothetical protein